MEIKKVNLIYENQKSKHLSIGAGPVIIRDGKVLLVRGKGGSQFKFPGGHVDDNETIKETVTREAMEEMGVKLKVNGEPYFYLFKLDENTDVILIHYLAEIVEGTPSPTTEIEEVGWFDVNNLPSTFDNVPSTLNFFKDQNKI